MKKLKYYIPMIIMMIFIFMMSHTTGDDSSAQSNFIVALIINLFKIDHDTLSFIVRKMAHFSEYALLAISIYYGLNKNNVSKHLMLYTFLITFFYACFDEIHQLFIPGRAGQIRDVLIDTSGTIIIFIWHLFKKSKT